ncbi:MAG: threonine-phosphate decarboxylase CobD [Cyanobacteria bacterium J06638_28]
MLNTRPVHGGNRDWAAPIAGCSPCDLLDFSANISPLGPPASAIAAIQANLHRLTEYPNPRYDSLRTAIARHHTISPEWVLPGNGAAELLTWAGRALANYPATYLVTPAFGDYQRALVAFDALITPCPLSLTAAESGNVDWLATIAQSLCHDPQHCGLLLNTPHNPTGLMMPLEVLATLLEQFALVVVDEAFMDFLPPASQQSLIAGVEQWPNLVVLRSLTKFYSLAGLRLGYAIAHPKRLQHWQTWRDPWSVNTLAARVGEVVLQDHAYQQASWLWVTAARSQLLADLAHIPGIYPFPGQANYLLLRVDRPGSQIQHDLLQQHHILVRDCLSFPELGDRYIRVAVRTKLENSRLCQALADVMV